MKVEEYVPAPTLTTFRVGGFVRRVITIETVEEVEFALKYAQSFGLPVVPFGGGSNIVLSDGTIDITAIKYAPSKIFQKGVRLTVDAGTQWDTLVQYAVENNLWGVENLSAIPGTVGGAVVQNVGAYGASLSQALLTVVVFDIHEMRTRTFHVSDCLFGYRQSRFKTAQDRYLVLRAEFELTTVATPNTTYADLARAFVGRVPKLSDVRREVIRIRSEKFPPLSTIGSAGSYFLNPIVSETEARGVQEKFPNMPVFHLPEGGVKVPLGWYFDHVLGMRGYREGNVEAWHAQALVIAAHPGATGGEVRQFVKKISARAFSELGIIISPEVREI